MLSLLLDQFDNQPHLLLPNSGDDVEEIKQGDRS